MFTHFKPITLAVSLLTALTTAYCIPINSGSTIHTKTFPSPSSTVYPSTVPTTSGTVRPSSVPTTSSSVPYGVMIQQCTQPGVIALTFDDGPFTYTPALLDMLAEFGAHATFFVNGEGTNFKYADYAAVMARIVDEGHQIGSHTFSHAHLTWISPDAVTEEMTTLESTFQTNIGRIPTYMRPPFLEVDDSVLSTLTDLGYHVIGTDLDTKDYANNNPSSIHNSVEHFRQGLDAGGSIVLAHDVHEQTVEVLAREMLTMVQERGLTAVPVGECLGDPEGSWYK
ncbi:chitin deacetylase [Aspergillus candidus]|uniref:Glycoside hydrolase/deacetylase n=1 Tax=Aspergillus candidus TaxID=41067 RepID=A0A2I2FB65_ASPCN|nr:glycoside hydrolase/deacetylase [Aspergillus candidus]PLB37872.1 glycoside hydrolase/deacetylase [Aspergillus candidus]